MMSAELPPNAIPSRPMTPQRLDSRYVMFALGVLTPLGVFTSVTFGEVPVSILWMAAVIAIFSGSVRITGIHLLYLTFAIVLLGKGLVGGSAGTGVKYMVGVVFLLSLNQVNFREGQYFFKGLNALIPVCLLYALYQWIVVLVFHDTVGYGATLPVELWNSKGWHQLLVDTWNLPRAPAFMFEPAYFAMILDAALAGELLYRRSRPRPLLILLVIVSLVLANSRVGLFAALLIVSSAWLVAHRRLGFLRTLAVLAAIGPLLPLPFISEQLVDFSNNRDVIDISVFARYISFVAFSQEPTASILFGVLSYSDTFLNNPIFSTFSDLLEGQGSNADPKSFLASNLFQFGVAGSVVFYAGQIYLFRSSCRALALLASINIIFFNVYAYSWPLYWIMICLTVITARVDRAARTTAIARNEAAIP
jgi:hypothetical protein